MIPNIIDIPGIVKVMAGPHLIWERFTAPIEILGFTAAGISSGALITANERLRFTVRNADGTVRYSGNFSTEYPGDFADFEEDGWIEIQHDHNAITQLSVSGKQLKTLAVSTMPNAIDLDFSHNKITTVVLSALQNLESLNMRGNPLSSISGIPNTKLNWLDLRDTIITDTGITSVLQDLVLTGVMNGTFHYSVKPTPAGESAYNTLVSRNWVLSIAPDSWAEVVVNAYEARVLADYGVVEDKEQLILDLQND